MKALIFTLAALMAAPTTALAYSMADEYLSQLSEYTKRMTFTSSTQEQSESSVRDMNNSRQDLQMPTEVQKLVDGLASKGYSVSSYIGREARYLASGTLIPPTHWEWTETNSTRHAFVFEVTRSDGVELLCSGSHLDRPDKDYARARVECVSEDREAYLNSTYYDAPTFNDGTYDWINGFRFNDIEKPTDLLYAQALQELSDEKAQQKALEERLAADAAKAFAESGQEEPDFSIPAMQKHLGGNNNKGIGGANADR